MMIGWPRASLSGALKARAMMSVVAPGGKATTMRMGLSGQAAQAVAVLRQNRARALSQSREAKHHMMRP